MIPGCDRRIGYFSNRLLRKHGAREIKLLCIIAAREGIMKISTYPDVKIYCAAFDEELNENAYIVPGLHAGDKSSELKN